MLGPRRERPYGRRAAKYCDELTPPHGRPNPCCKTYPTTSLAPFWPAGTVISGFQTVTLDNFGTVLPFKGTTVAAFIPGNGIQGMTTLVDNNSVDNIEIGNPALGLAPGLNTVLQTVTMNNTTNTQLTAFIQAAVLGAAAAPALAINLNGTGTLFNPGSNPALFVNGSTANGGGVLDNNGYGFAVDGGLKVGPDGGAAGYGTFNINVTGNNALALSTAGATSLTAINIAGSGALLLDAQGTSAAGEFARVVLLAQSTLPTCRRR